MLSKHHVNHFENIHTNTVSYIPIRGTESDVAGMISATSNMKTVRDSRTVIPAETHTDRQI